MSRWRRIIPRWGATDSALLRLYQNEKADLQSDMDKATSYPEGKQVWTRDGYVPRDEWMLEAQAAMTVIDEHIVNLS